MYSNNMEAGIKQALELIRGRRKPAMLLVAGKTCAGKSELSRLLSERIEATLVDLDGYYKEIDDSTLPMFSCRRTFDAPGSYRRLEIRKDVRDLMAGKSVRGPVYDIKTNRRVKNSWKILRAADVIIVDGLFAIRELMDDYSNAVKVYVVADTRVRLARRIERNLEIHGISEAATVSHFYEKVEPLHERYVQCQMALADLVVKGE
jgi:uridine kinase